MTPEEALEKKAENARELGLDYEPAHQEPVAWMHPANPTCVTTDPTAYARGIPLYTSPPAQRTWVGVTMTDREKLRDRYGWNYPPLLVDAVSDILEWKNT